MRFDAAVGRRRGLRGPHAKARDTADKPARTLVCLLHSPDADARRAAARTLAERLRAGQTTVTQRSVLWAHSIGTMDPVAHDLVMGGLCDHLRARGTGEDINQAVVYLAAADWDADTAPRAVAVYGALTERLRADHRLQASELFEALADAFETAPRSEHLAKLLVAHAWEYSFHAKAYPLR